MTRTSVHPAFEAFPEATRLRRVREPRRSRVASFGAASVALLLGGCLSPDPARPVADAPARFADAPGAVTRVRLRVYELDLPPGGFTDNPAVWRRLDNAPLGVAETEVLWANGVRVAIGTTAQINDVIDAAGLAPAGGTAALSADDRPRTIDLDRGPGDSHGPGRQTVVRFDANKDAHGRTYRDARNRLVIEFAPAPGGGATRVTISPVVQSERSRLRVRADGGEYEVDRVRDEATIELGLSVDLADGQFLLVAPSPDAGRVTSVGRAFFRRESAGQVKESGLLVVPERVTLTPGVLPGSG